MTQSLNYLPLQQTMPLMNPSYPPQYYQQFTQMKKHIQLKLFNSRANELAQWLIPYGQSNYNCWYVKKMCYLNVAITYEHEMKFSQETLYEKVKNFQLWEHRRFMLQKKNQRQEYEKEYELVYKILKIQPKNYHAWSHRVWLVNQVQNYPDQINFTHQLLKQDNYNNSVWAYRFYLFSKILQQQKDNLPRQQKLGYVEINQTLATIQHHLNNQAAWNYLRGYFPSINLSKIPSTNKLTAPLCKCYNLYPNILQFVKFQIQKLQKLFQSLEFKPKNYHFQAQIQLLITLVCIESQSESTKQYAKNTCLVLAQKDKQKRFYWKWVANNL